PRAPARGSRPWSPPERRPRYIASEPRPRRAREPLAHTLHLLRKRPVTSTRSDRTIVVLSYAHGRSGRRANTGRGRDGVRHGCIAPRGGGGTSGGYPERARDARLARARNGHRRQLRDRGTTRNGRYGRGVRRAR